MPACTHARPVWLTAARAAVLDLVVVAVVWAGAGARPDAQGACDTRGIARTLTAPQIEKMAIVAVEFVGKVLLPELDEK
jgi:hypothetical protein